MKQYGRITRPCTFLMFFFWIVDSWCFVQDLHDAVPLQWVCQSDHPGAALSGPVNLCESCDPKVSMRMNHFKDFFALRDLQLSHPPIPKFENSNFSLQVPTTQRIFRLMNARTCVLRNATRVVIRFLSFIARHCNILRLNCVAEHLGARRASSKWSMHQSNPRVGVGTDRKRQWKKHVRNGKHDNHDKWTKWTKRRRQKIKRVWEKYKKEAQKCRNRCLTASYLENKSRSKNRKDQQDHEDYEETWRNQLCA